MTENNAEKIKDDEQKEESLDSPDITDNEVEKHNTYEYEQKSISTETVWAIFQSIKVVFEHPVNLFGELLLFITCALAFSFAPNLESEYGEAPTNIIIVTLFVITVIVAIRLFYVSNINTMLEYIAKHRWKTLWAILWAILKLALVALIISIIFLLHHFLPELARVLPYIESLFDIVNLCEKW